MPKDPQKPGDAAEPEFLTAELGGAFQKLGLLGVDVTREQVVVALRNPERTAELSGLEITALHVHFEIDTESLGFLAPKTRDAETLGELALIEANLVRQMQERGILLTRRGPRSGGKRGA